MASFRLLLTVITIESAEVHGVNIGVFIFYRHKAKIRGRVYLIQRTSGQQSFKHKFMDKRSVYAKDGIHSL